VENGKLIDFELILKIDGYKLLNETKRVKYYVSDKGLIARRTKNTFKELGYIEDNMSLYKRLCESI
jgi:hypothetical protein